MNDGTVGAKRAEAMVGCLLGTLIGDAVGLAGEGLSRRRQQKLYPHLDGPRFLLGRGMVSDDTEHACMTAQALIASDGDVEAFRHSLARQLRVWLLCVPAGIGLATLKAILKLLVGVGPENSGVFSAGNGPCMRSAIIGVCFGDDPARMWELVRASTRLTHTDPQAEWGALVVALASHMSAQSAAQNTRIDADAYFRRLVGLLDEVRGRGDEFRAGGDLLILATLARTSAESGETTMQFADSLKLERGVSGYVFHTVPVCLHAWFRHPRDVRRAVLDVVQCGGDTDTTGAIVGAIVGAGAGRNGIPADWLAAICEWPRSVHWIERVGRRLNEVRERKTPQRPVPLFLPGVLARNAVFLVVVFAHGLRRLFPPY